MEDECGLENGRGEDATIDELFNDITDLANSIENDLTEDVDSSDREHKNDIKDSSQVSSTDADDKSEAMPSKDVEPGDENCSLEHNEAEAKSDDVFILNNDHGIKAVEISNGDLRQGESQTNFSKDSHRLSHLQRSSSESCREDFDSHEDDLCRSQRSFTDVHNKSCSLSSTESEREFLKFRDKERQFARMSLERDKQRPIYSGFLNKLGGTGFTPKNWRRRWFVLKSDNCLYYYKNAKDSPVGAIVLSNYLVTTVLAKTSKSFVFQLTKGGARSYTFSAASEIEKKTWMKVIADAAKCEKQSPANPDSSIHNVSIPALSIIDPDCHGYLWKQGYSHKSWKKRYSVLKNGCLYYYQDMSETVALGVFNLHCYSVHETETTGRKYSFIAIPPQSLMRTYYFSAETELDRDRWLKAMIKSIDSAVTEGE